ncbi:MAG TPA: hypothetical protein VMU83_22755 [Hanamia sp.]|nr:hypothetical protein [Hanamia sp.]
MQRKLGKYAVLTFVAIIAIAVIIIYRIWNKPHVDIRDADAVKTTSIALYNILSKNGNDSAIYLNKVVEVSGVITSVSKNEQDQQIILLKTNVSGGSVNCTMEEEVNGKKPGDTIVLKGICSGYINGDMGMGLPGDVFLIRCYRSI